MSGKSNESKTSELTGLDLGLGSLLQSDKPFLLVEKISENTPAPSMPQVSEPMKPVYEKTQAMPDLVELHLARLLADRNLNSTEPTPHWSDPDADITDDTLEMEPEQTAALIKLDEVEIEPLRKFFAEVQSMRSSGMWNELISSAEGIINRGEQNKELSLLAEIFWVEGQLEAGGMPSNMLIAPIDKLSQACKESASDLKQNALLEKSLASVQASLGARLLAIAEHETALRMLKAAASSDHNFDSQLHEAAAVARRYLSEKVFSPSQQAEKLRITQLLSGIHSSKVQDTAPEVKLEASVPQKRKVTRALNLNLAWVNLKSATGLALFCMCIIGYSASSKTDELRDYQLGRLNLSAEAKPELLIALPERQTPSNKLTLWNILQSMDAPEVSVAQAVSEVEKAAAKPVVLKGAEVNTNGPLEPEALAQLLDRGDSELAIAQEVRTQTGVERIANGNKQSDTDYIVPPFPVAQGNYIPNGSLLGRQLILNRTLVYENPSVQARSLGEIDRGSEVEVAEELGKWVRIVSRRNRDGYIKIEAISNKITG